MSASQTSEFVYRPAASKSPATNMRDATLQQVRAAPSFISRISDIDATPEEQHALEALLMGQNEAGSETGQSAGVMLAEPIRARAGCLTAFLGSLALGCQWQAALDRAGLTYICVTALARYDKEGFGALLKLADAAQKTILVAEMRQALHKRAVEGVENVKIGRVDKDRDGIVRDEDGNPIIERKYSDKLLEFGLSKLDKDTFGEQAGQVNIGQQVVYNIQAFGIQPAARQPAQDAEIVEDSPEDGENPAKIDMDSIEDVDSL